MPTKSIHKRKKTQEFQRKFKSKLTKPLPKLKYASSINLGAFISPDDKKDESLIAPASAIPKDLTSLSPSNTRKPGSGRLSFVTPVNGTTTASDEKKSPFDMSDASCWVLNTDKLENTNATPE